MSLNTTTFQKTTSPPLACLLALIAVMAQHAGAQTTIYTGETVTVTDPATYFGGSGTITITPGSPTDHVRVVLPDIGEKMFARLKVTQ